MVDYNVRDSVAVLTVNNPPVNALSYHVREGIAANTRRANADPSVKAIVLMGRGKFLSGADIREFSTGMAAKEPGLTEVCDILENSQKPVIAAISEFALGGGLEVAISCHYRVGTQKSVYGFPEVNLGILPGATGTQRFPRLTSLEFALDLIPTGRRIGPQEALKHGVLDKIASGDLQAEAVSFARSVASRPVDPRRTSKMTVKDGHNLEKLKEAALLLASRKSKGMIAPIYNIRAVEESVKRPYKEGLEKEAEYSGVLFTSGQARALQYAFFAERVAKRWSMPGGANSSNTKPYPMKTGAVLGAGTMGTGIAMAMLNAGIPVTLVEQNQKFLDNGVRTLKGLYAGSVKLGRMTQEQANQRLAMLKPTVNFEALATVDLVVEAVYENISLKKEIFAKLDKICKPSAVLCSNTSALDIDAIAASTQRPDKVVGTHFFVPAYYMRLLENIRGKQTSPRTVATAMQFGEKIGKVSVLVGNCPGFVANRVMGNYAIEANFAIEDGALPRDVDQVIEDFGMPMGPLKVADLSGLDIGWRGRSDKLKALGKDIKVPRTHLRGARYCSLADKLVEAGRLGRKTGKGWYNYGKPGGKEPINDPEVTELIMNHCREMGITRRQVTQQEIYERCIFSAINECFRCLEEGIAAKPEDVDVCMLLGYAWPRQTGGPMFHASEIGLKRVYERICHYNDIMPDVPHWIPSPLLKKLAEANVPFNKWSKHLSSNL